MIAKTCGPMLVTTTTWGTVARYRDKILGDRESHRTICFWSNRTTVNHEQNSLLTLQTRPRPPVIRYAENLGATVADTVGSNTTYVVAAKDGTDKTLAARRVPGCAVVKTSWLMECVWSMTLRPVQPHLLGRSPSQRGLSLPPPSPITAAEQPSVLTSASSNVSTLETDTPSLVPSKLDNNSSTSSGSSDEDGDDELCAEFESEFM